MVIFAQKWLSLSKSCCFRAKIVVFEQSGRNLTKLLYSGKVVVFE